MSAARNAGARAASGEVLVFIDDDCVVGKGATARLAAALETDADVGMVGPVIAYLEDRERVWCAGVRRTKWTGRTALRGHRRPVSEMAFLAAPSDEFPSVFAVRRSDFLALGGFDEQRFPMEMSEAEFGERVRRSERRVELVSEAVVFHDLSIRDPLARRLHVHSAERAFHVGRGRTTFISCAGSAALRVRWLAAWLFALAPVYVGASLCDRSKPPSRRVHIAAAFVHGIAAGLRRPSK
jgi:GT2 family glycosyltransferase